MPTSKPRVNITFEPFLQETIAVLAKLEHKSVSGLAKELILEALERREDICLAKIAENREQKKGKLYNHEDAWK